MLRKKGLKSAQRAVQLTARKTVSADGYSDIVACLAKHNFNQRGNHNAKHNSFCMTTFGRDKISHNSPSKKTGAPVGYEHSLMPLR